MTADPTPDRPTQLRVGSLDYTPGALDTSHLRPDVAEHHQAVAAELIDHAARCVLDILAVTMHHADFTYNVTAELVNNLVTFATTRTPDLCCTHGQQLNKRAERLLNLLEEVHQARKRLTSIEIDPPRRWNQRPAGPPVKWSDLQRLVAHNRIERITVSGIDFDDADSTSERDQQKQES